MEAEILAPVVEIETASMTDELERLCRSQHRVKLIIPDGTITIGRGAFNQCSALTEVRFPETLTRIEVIAFQGCRYLTEVRFPPDSALIEIKENAFYDTALTEIHFPVALTTIYPRAFCTCTALAEVHFPPDSALTEIGGYAFYKCTALTEVRFPPALTTIGDRAFLGCDALTEVHFPPALTTIRGWRVPAFLGCDALTEVRCLSTQLVIISPALPINRAIGIAAVCPATIGTLAGDQYNTELRVPLDGGNFDPETQVLPHVDAAAIDEFDIVYEEGNLRDHLAEVLLGQVDFQRLVLVYR